MNEAALPLPLYLLFFAHRSCLRLLLFFLFQGQTNWGAFGEEENPLQVEPKWPVVQVGGSIALRCSLTCPQKEATVQWRGLDTSLGHVSSMPGFSILTIPEATIPMAGSMLCTGTCQGKNHRNVVKLQVYAFPDKLQAFLKTQDPGQDATLTCSVQDIYPIESLTFTWYLGEEKLEGLHLEKEEEGEHEAESREEAGLFWVSKHWVLPAALVARGPELRCLVEMKLERQVFNHSRAVTVIPRMTSPAPSTTLPTTTTMGPELLSSEATTREGYSSSLPSTTAFSLTLDPGSSPPAASTSRSFYSCSPHISLSQGSGVHGRPLELICQAICKPEATVTWIQTLNVTWIQVPGRLEDYQRREAGVQATLTLLHLGPLTWGVYKCQVEPGGQKASYHLKDTRTAPDYSAVLWTGGCTLGLILTAFVAYRLRRWFCYPQSQAQP